MYILGISAYYHDSSAALIKNGEIIAAAQEERFTEIKNDSSFPVNAIKFCLQFAKISAASLDAIVYYEKPFLKLERLLESYLSDAPKGFFSFIQTIPDWIRHKIFLKKIIRKEFYSLDANINWQYTSLLFSNHHLSHAASSFFTTKFKEAAILTIDGVGEYATATISLGKDRHIKVLKELKYPHSLGLFYSYFTYFLGFEINSGEYKLMGLAPFGKYNKELTEQYVQLIKAKLIQILEDGSLLLPTEYFSLVNSSLKNITKNFEKLFGFKKRNNSDPIKIYHASLANAVQVVAEEVVLKMAIYAKSITQSDNLCLAGGVALNGVINGKLKESGLFKNIFIQPAAGDAGGSVGAALAAYYLHFKSERSYPLQGNVNNVLLGPAFSKEEIQNTIEKKSLNSQFFIGDALYEEVVNRLLKAKVVAWFEGRMEFGPRALGSRSILANPLVADMQTRLNLKVKKRESFRPFAPIMLMEEFEKFFAQSYHAPYMQFVHTIKEAYRLPDSLIFNNFDVSTLIKQKRSVLPAITHVDFSSRIQTVLPNSSEGIAGILKKFKKHTGYGILINTSFNLNNMPIVCNPQQAINCFLQTEIDCLVLDGFLMDK